jgi:hypothetical protein
MNAPCPKVEYCKVHKCVIDTRGERHQCYLCICDDVNAFTRRYLPPETIKSMYDEVHHVAGAWTHGPS